MAIFERYKFYHARKLCQSLTRTIDEISCATKSLRPLASARFRAKGSPAAPRREIECFSSSSPAPAGGAPAHRPQTTAGHCGSAGLGPALGFAVSRGQQAGWTSVLSCGRQGSPEAAGKRGAPRRRADAYWHRTFNLCCRRAAVLCFLQRAKLRIGPLSANRRWSACFNRPFTRRSL